jgi:hypothetical protein
MAEEEKKPELSVAERADAMPKGLSYAIRESIATLQVLQETDKARVHEAIFVRDVLPVLCGDEGQTVDMAWWGGRFDSPFKGFLIVNDDNEVLFEVPPLLDRNFDLVPARHARDSINEDRANYTKRVYNRPGDAKAEYAEAMRRRLDLTKTGRPLQHMHMLDKIFIHYGRPSIFEQDSRETIKLAVESSGLKVAPTEAPATQVFSEENYSEEGLLD